MNMATDSNMASTSGVSQASSAASSSEAFGGDGSEQIGSRQAPQKPRRPMRSTTMFAGGRQSSAGRLHKICPVNQLRNIALDENGTFMSDFDPERSQREMRKLNRKIHKENKKQNQMYDESGRLLENSLDVCDCLENECTGCHFPCSKCGSEKCGAECRCERRWLYEQIEVEGTTHRFTWSATKLA